jgi:glutamate-1-semialdehyde 2,1-aminomutase
MSSPSALSTYPDVDAIYTRLNALIRQPIRPVRREKMQEYLTWFDTQCQRSKALTDEAKKYIPGGVQHNLAFNYPFPIAIEKAEDAHLWDVDGNRYIDFLQAGGPTLLGSTPPCGKKSSNSSKPAAPSPACFTNTSSNSPNSSNALCLQSKCSACWGQARKV